MRQWGVFFGEVGLYGLYGHNNFTDDHRKTHNRNGGIFWKINMVHALLHNFFYLKGKSGVNIYMGQENCPFQEKLVFHLQSLIKTLSKQQELSNVPSSLRRGGRVVEGARLEIVYTATYRGFESLSLRHYL